MFEGGRIKKEEKDRESEQESGVTKEVVTATTELML